MFYGPAPRGLLLEVRGIFDRSGAGAKAAVEREPFILWPLLLHMLNEQLRCHIDLSFLQLLPCVWRKFCKIRDRLLKNHQEPTREDVGRQVWKTRYREVQNFSLCSSRT